MITWAVAVYVGRYRGRFIVLPSLRLQRPSVLRRGGVGSVVSVRCRLWRLWWGRARLGVLCRPGQYEVRYCPYALRTGYRA